MSALQTAPTTRRPSTIGLVVLLGAMAALGAVTIDLYLPSLPEVAEDLGTTHARTQLTITGVLVGSAFGQLVVGPLSDAFGRRWPRGRGSAGRGRARGSRRRSAGRGARARGRSGRPRLGTGLNGGVAQLAARLRQRAPDGDEDADAGEDEQTQDRAATPCGSR